MPDTLHTHASRLYQRLVRLGEFGHIEGTERGVNSLALTDSNFETRIQLLQWMEEQGLHIHIDGIGNIIAVRAAKDGNTTDNIILAGSHVDTVPTGGIFDGRLGVLGALEALQSMNENGVETDFPVAVALFTAEEGARYQPAMIGSRVFTGLMQLRDALAVKSHVQGDESIMGEELERFRAHLAKAHAEGRLTRDYSAMDAALGKNNVRAFLELHIEQGPDLLDRGVAVAAVQNVLGISQRVLAFSGATREQAGLLAAAITREVRAIAKAMEGEPRGTVGVVDVSDAPKAAYSMTFHIEGVSAHAGACPMRLRQDAGYAAAELAAQFTKLAEGFGLAAQVSHLRFLPGTINVVPEGAEITLGLNGAIPQQRQAIGAAMEAHAQALEKAEGVAIQEIPAATPLIRFGAPGMTVDLRNESEALIDEADARLEGYLRELAAQSGVSITSERKQRLAPVQFHGGVLDVVGKVAEKLGFGHHKATLGAGHDACNFAIVGVPTAMLAIRNSHGSHNVQEYAALEDVAAGADALMHSMLELAGKNLAIAPEAAEVLAHPQRLTQVFTADTARNHDKLGRF